MHACVLLLACIISTCCMLFNRDGAQSGVVGLLAVWQVGLVPAPVTDWSQAQTAEHAGALASTNLPTALI